MWYEPFYQQLMLLDLKIWVSIQLAKKTNICTFFQDKILNRAALVGIPPVLGSIFNEVAGWKSTFIKKK